jgi:hypothetical protein
MNPKNAIANIAYTIPKYPNICSLDEKTGIICEIIPKLGRISI